MNNSIRLTVIILLLGVSNVFATTRYVWQDSPSQGPPYTNWTTAAHVIQDAVNAAAAGDRIVVTNGLYATGGTAAGTGYPACRVNVNKAVAVVSVNGPQVTIIRGDQVCMPGPPPLGELQIIGPACVWLTSGASLTGFTLTNGMAYSGGGVECPIGTNAVVTNCVIVGNSAPGWTVDGFGGGAYGGALYSCVLKGNTAAFGGGGAAHSMLYNCRCQQLACGVYLLLRASGAFRARSITASWPTTGFPHRGERFWGSRKAPSTTPSVS